MILSPDYRDQSIVICAFRYALGRRSYMPSLVADWIKEHWSQIDATNRELIAREIEQALERGEAGDRMDEDVWRALSKWIEEQPS